MIIKPIGAEISIATANVVGNNVLVRVINPGAAAVLHFANSGGEYANLTVVNTFPVIVQKRASDTLQGTGMLAVPVSYKG